MRIAIVSHRFTKHSGQGRANYELVKYLLKKGHKIDLYTQFVDPMLKLKVNHCYIIKVIVRPILFQVLLFAILSTLKLLGKSYDIVHIDGGCSFYPPDVSVCHFSHSGFLKYESGIYYRLYALINAQIERFCYKSIKNKVIAISNRMFKELTEYVRIASLKVQVIYYGVNTNEFNPTNHSSARNRLIKELGLNSSDFLVLFVGDLSHRKGLDYLAEAIKFLSKDVKLIIAGKKKSTYLRMTELSNIADRVRFIGFREDTSNLFKGADLFILPSLYEPFGLVVLEAMASEIPVIVSRRAGVAELITNTENGILLSEPTNTMEIVSKINLLKHNNLLRHRIGSNARKTALQYPWKKMAKQVEDLYWEILHEK